MLVFPYRCFKQAHNTERKGSHFFLKQTYLLSIQNELGRPPNTHTNLKIDEFFFLACKGFKGRCAQPPLF